MRRQSGPATDADVHPIVFPGWKAAHLTGLEEPYLQGEGWKAFTPKDMFRFAEAVLVMSNHPEDWEHPGFSGETE